MHFTDLAIQTIADDKIRTRSSKVNLIACRVWESHCFLRRPTTSIGGCVGNSATRACRSSCRFYPARIHNNLRAKVLPPLILSLESLSIRQTGLLFLRVLFHCSTCQIFPLVPSGRAHAAGAV